MSAGTKINDPWTSFVAASTVDEIGSQAYVRDLFTRWGAMADFQMVDHAHDDYRADPSLYPYSDSRLRSARHELTDAQVLEEYGPAIHRPRPARQTPHLVHRLVPDEPETPDEWDRADVEYARRKEEW